LKPDKLLGYYYIFGKGMRTGDEKMTPPDDVNNRYLELKKQLGYAAGNGKPFISGSTPALSSTGICWRILMPSCGNAGSGIRRLH